MRKKAGKTLGETLKAQADKIERAEQRKEEERTITTEKVIRHLNELSKKQIEEFLRNFLESTSKYRKYIHNRRKDEVIITYDGCCTMKLSEDWEESLKNSRNGKKICSFFERNGFICSFIHGIGDCYGDDYHYFSVVIEW